MTKALEYHFADCRLNAATRDLWLRGERQRIEPRVLDFLVYLIEQRDRVVRKDELIAHVWDGEILTDSVLARAASKARKAIGDVADDPTLVRTVHSVGYRFIGDIRIVESPKEEPSTGVHLRSMPAAATFVPAGPTEDPHQAPSGSPLIEIDSAGAGGSAVRMPPDASEDIRYFALNDEMAAWSAALPALRGAARLDMLVKLAWHLRQRDTSRALALADEADALLGGARNAEVLRARARLMLVRGEAKWLAGQLHVALDLAQQAASLFDACADLAGSCDAELLQLAISMDRDDPATRAGRARAALAKVKALDDDERHALLQLRLALAEADQNPANTRTSWAGRVEHWLAACGPGVRAACLNVQGTWAFGSGDRAQMLRLALAARELCVAAGLRRDAVRQTANAGAMFSNLFDNEAALEWTTAALTEARATGWPTVLMTCLALSAGLLITLNRPAEAVGLLDEAQHLLAALPAGRFSILTRMKRGEVHSALGDHAAALAAYEQAAAEAKSWRLAPVELEAMYGRVRALADLGRSAEAREAALEALTLAEAHHNDYFQYLLLERLATIYRDHPNLPVESVAEPSVVLHYLLRAVKKQGTGNAKTVPAALLEALAAEYARLGDFASAYAYQVRSQTAYAEEQSTEVSSRAIAMKIRHDAERARADSEHHRALAAAHAERAEALAQTNATLARVATIGQEITRHLEARSVFDALERHVHGMLDASSLAVFLLDSGGKALELAFGVESGVPLPSLRVALNDPEANVARCARECREIHVDSIGDEVCGIPGTLPTRSALFAPLSTGTQVLGVLTVQSPRAGAYGEREQLVLRSLSAYSAVALINAAAYHRLESARDALALTHAELLDKDLELETARRALERLAS